ncbi:sulfatase [Polaribacter pacificus]|uniref:Sulfatase n=1 Tax=Polaribacter pacificus TaxID=1775173 RepID=A0A917HZT1_9FLAO|nr:LTA synthase family protein [Polaribacter pacificus]GGG99663.1 sulfatase [Polaribacter pacificus]
MKQKIPNYIQYLFVNVFFVFLYALLFRGIFYGFFAQLDSVSKREIGQAFSLGIRFDLKLAVLAVFPIAILLFIVNQRFFKAKIYKKISSIYLTLIYLVLTIFYLVDFGYYEYLGIRLDAASLRFLSNLKISTQVLIESYPVYKGLFGLLILVFLIYRFNSYIYTKLDKNTRQISKKKKAFYIVIPFLILAFGIYNSFTHYPLRWSQSFFSKNQAVNQFALNPVLYFYDSFAFRNSGFNLEETKKYYPTIANYLGLSKDVFSFEKPHTANDSIKNKPNVVIVMLESVGVAPMSYFGNPISTTPKMDSIAKQSALFTNFYVHKAGTAGSVFASITGLPDIDNISTASRNPMVIDQRIVFDQFKGYEKLYFLGGSANWANIRGVFQSNVNDLQIFEEGSYADENRADVWGIDDYELFKQSDKKLAELNRQNKPFIAYIQTATNHMPFTVPEQKESYKPLAESDVSLELLEKSGFKSVAQLNAIRYLDFNVDEFLKRAKKSGYYDNTIFLFFGDHNTAMNPVDFLEKKEFDLETQVHHVPFFINAPKFISPKTHNHYAKLVDLMPTAASLANINYTNYTLGNDALNTDADKSFAFLYKTINGEPAVAVLKDDFYYTYATNSKNTNLYSINSGELVDIKNQFPVISKQLDSLVKGYYNATKYLYYNNKKLSE